MLSGLFFGGVPLVIAVALAGYLGKPRPLPPLRQLGVVAAVIWLGATLGLLIGGGSLVSSVALGAPVVLGVFGAVLCARWLRERRDRAASTSPSQR